MKIQKVLCDYYNRTLENVDAICHYNVSKPIIDYPDDYQLSVETAELSLTQVPLDFEANYKVRVVDLSGETPTVDRVLPSKIENINHFIDVLNDGVRDTRGNYLIRFNVDHTSLLSSYYSPPNDDDGPIEFDFMHYMNKPLYDILYEFNHDKGPKHSIMIDGEEFIKINLLGNGEETRTPQKQTAETISNLVKFKSVRFLTTLPVRPYMVYKQEQNVMTEMNILTTVKINSANFDLVNQRNLLYIPNVIRELELNSTTPITSFQIQIEIYYATGHTFNHKLAPNEYFEIALSFKQINNSNV